MSESIAIPLSLLQKFFVATTAFQELEDELENFLLTYDPVFIAKMRQARKEQVEKELSAPENLEQALCVK